MLNTLFYIRGQNRRYEEFLINCNKEEIQDILAEQGRVLREISSDELRIIQQVVLGQDLSSLSESEIRRVLRTYTDEELLYLADIEESNGGNRYSIETYHDLPCPLSTGAPNEDEELEETIEKGEPIGRCYEAAPNSFMDIDPLHEALHLIHQLEKEQKLPQLGALLGENTLALLRQEYTPQTVNIRIDSHWRILSEDADIEVKMPTLSKVLYFLFLRHPEGIVLKQIADYKEELLKIYLLFSPARTMADVTRSIDALTDGLDGSINQKISRVNAAFQATLAYSSDWQITGKRGDVKKVEGAAQIILPERLKTLK